MEVRSYYSEPAFRLLEFHPRPTVFRWARLDERYRRILRIWSWRHAVRTMHRTIRDAARFDVVFLQWVFPPVPLTNALLAANPNVIYDFDDPVFLYDTHAAPHLIRSARLISTGSHFSLQYVRSLGLEAVLLPTPVPLPTLQAAGSSRRTGNSAFRIGWLGNPSTVGYLQLLQEPLNRLVAKYPGKISLTVIGSAGSSDRVPVFSGLRLEVIPWLEESRFKEVISTFDVGVMPLFDTERERGKCGLKALWYMTFGVPVIASSVGEAGRIITHGVNGLLAATPESWYESLCALVEQPALRRRLGTAGRRTVEERYCTEVCYRILRDEVLGRVLVGYPSNLIG
ncbi:MAG: glycosyltransferase family 4 protein, partial [Kiritimatiellia bacterium]